mmetsp:Transcript_4336/g.13290  ORF Transcript_4336/g.13290 Transcript_4336/m.13290 type:complete len:242 (+) Transcript_4336:2942-3667(+)
MNADEPVINGVSDPNPPAPPVVIGVCIIAALGSFLGVSSHLLAFLRVLCVVVVVAEEGCWFLGVASSHRFLLGFFPALSITLVESSSSHSFFLSFPTDSDAFSSSSQESFCSRLRCSLTFSVSAAESSILATPTLPALGAPALSSSSFALATSHRLRLFLFFSTLPSSSSSSSFSFSRFFSARCFASSSSFSLFLSMFLIVSSFSLASICSRMASLYPLLFPSGSSSFLSGDSWRRNRLLL